MQKEIKRVLFLTVDFPPMGGGMARHSYDVCEALIKLGYNPVVIAPSDGKTACAADGAFEVCRLKSVRGARVFDNYALSVAAFFFRALFYCCTRRPLFLVANTWSVAGLAAFFIKKCTGIPYAVFAHGLDVYAPQVSMKEKRIMDAVLEDASAVIANSSFTRRLVEEATNRARVTVVNPAIDPARLVFPENAGSGEPRRGREILTVARLVESKGHDLVIRALPKVLRRFPDTVYRIVGKGPLEASLKKLAADTEVGDRVIFSGEVDERTLAAYYRACDIFVLTSRQVRVRGEVEGFGIVFLEAGIFGKPVVASRSGGIPDAVVDGVNGIIADSAEPEAIADAISRLLSDRVLAERMGRAGQVRAETEFAPERFAERLKEALWRVVR